ncbi:MAG: PadR family transcriptional regulator [Actinomycetota bacterium]
MAVREALLTLLADGPKHGYQLKADFETATGQAWPLNVGQVYTTLQRLERDGLVEPTDAGAATGDDDEPPPGGRVPYALTEAGLAVFRQWLVTPSPADLANRDETTMRVLLALAAESGSVAGLLRAQRQATTETLQALTAMRADGDPSLAWSLQLDRMVFLAEAELRWLDRAEERVAATGEGDAGAATASTPTSPGADDRPTPATVDAAAGPGDDIERSSEGTP